MFGKQCGMQLRELDSNDEAALFALEVQCFERPYSRKQVDDELNHPASLEIGYFDEFLVGAIALRLVHDEWWIFRIMVHPAFRRKAIASQLLEEAKKYGELWLEVS